MARSRCATVWFSDSGGASAFAGPSLKAEPSYIFVKIARAFSKAFDAEARRSDWRQRITAGGGSGGRVEPTTPDRGDVRAPRGPRSSGPRRRRDARKRSAGRQHPPPERGEP